MIKDIYYQKGYPDPIFNDEYVLNLVRPFVPNAREVCGIDETGGEARTYTVDSNIILKVQRPGQLRLSTSLEREVFFLRYLEKHCDANVPRVLGYGKEGTVEYTVMTRMPGKAYKYADLTAKQRENMLFELGKTLYKIHNIDKKPFYESGLYPDIDVPSDMKERLKARFDRILNWLLERGHIKHADIDFVGKQAAPIFVEVPDAEILTPLHSNPGPEHVFVNDDGTFSGLIDFGDSYISHPVFDFRSTHVRDRSLLLAGYTCDGKELSNNFAELWNAAYALDSLIDVLRNKKQAKLTNLR